MINKKLAAMWPSIWLTLIGLNAKIRKPRFSVGHTNEKRPYKAGTGGYWLRQYCWKSTCRDSRVARPIYGSFITWLREAISGTTPPYSWWISICNDLIGQDFSSVFHNGNRGLITRGLNTQYFHACISLFFHFTFIDNVNNNHCTENNCRAFQCRSQTDE